MERAWGGGGVVCSGEPSGLGGLRQDGLGVVWSCPSKLHLAAVHARMWLLCKGVRTVAVAALLTQRPSQMRPQHPKPAACHRSGVLSCERQTEVRSTIWRRCRALDPHTPRPRVNHALPLTMLAHPHPALNGMHPSIRQSRVPWSIHSRRPIGHRSGEMMEWLPRVVGLTLAFPALTHPHSVHVSCIPKGRSPARIGSPRIQPLELQHGCLMFAQLQIM